ncbi:MULTISPECIES: hypothetical protein [Flammeovirga]|uniref:Uncharacterized protein n=1 Tax=Flammeovirga agarivorans TaxID=2726742 RepID=A0A7X8XU00_9BACT|nr:MULTISPECIES: hypothetical protein [Flammeovirga]NLR89851.1 hypothetical protein [Flammeovirga agarivorans]
MKLGVKGFNTILLVITILLTCYVLIDYMIDGIVSYSTILVTIIVFSVLVFLKVLRGVLVKSDKKMVG